MLNRIIQCRLRAFTIVELLVSIILSALVLASAYLLFAHFALSMFRNTNKSQSVQMISGLQNNLISDFQLCDSAILNKDSLFCHFATKRVGYFFSPNLIIRWQAGISDTFPVVLEGYSFYFLEQSSTEGLIDQFSVKFTHQEQTLQLTSNKAIDAATLMLSEPK